jgi:hypothetical protein
MAPSQVTFPDDKRLQPDEALLRDCRVETFRGPGPGGQKRNKTSSAVRITHQPTGLSAIAGESRSQSQNKSTALRRLRLRMAIELRQPIDPAGAKPDWFRLDVSPRNEHYPAVVGFVLDTLAAVDWALAPAREVLGVGSSHLIKFLQAHPDVWTAVQQARTARGLHPLK